MNPILRNILAVLAGLVSGSILNMGIIIVSGSIIPPPDDADITTNFKVQLLYQIDYKNIFLVILNPFDVTRLIK